MLLGRIDLAIFATFGAFAGIYGRNEPHRQRLVTQARGGGLMFAFILAGALTARADIGPWTLVLLGQAGNLLPAHRTGWAAVPLVLALHFWQRTARRRRAA